MALLLLNHPALVRLKPDTTFRAGSEAHNDTMTRLTVLFALMLAADVTNAVAQSPSPPQLPPPSPTAFANVEMPSWVRIGVEHRGRLEGPIGTGFAADREDLYWLNRFRVTARFSIAPWLSAPCRRRMRASRAERPGCRRAVPRQFDLRLAHADVGNLERSRLASAWADRSSRSAISASSAM
jgi:hypothetical protein